MPSMGAKYQDYYEILGVTRSATQKEVQRAFRKLARQYHPDVNQDPDAEERFKQINEAHAVLGDAEKRKLYDSLGHDWEAGQQFTPPPGWENVQFEFRTDPNGGAHGFHFGSNGSGGAGSPFGDRFGGAGGGGGLGGFSEFFETLFGGAQGFTFEGGRNGGPTFGFDRHAGRRSLRGQDHEAEITISLEEAYHGARKTIRLEAIDGSMQRSQKSYQVRIPAGVTDGSRIRLGGQGGQSGGGGQSGDLYLRVRLAPHATFRLQGRDLEHDLRVTPWEAALGAKVKVPTIDGKVKIALPAGARSGQRLRVRGKGMPEHIRQGADSKKNGTVDEGNDHGGSRGDLYVVVQIAVPERLSARERELFEQLARESSFDPRGES